MTGRDAVDGEDSRCECLIETEEVPGLLLENGEMDFRERGTIQNVKANTAVYECLPPTEGAAGVDVYGQIVKPRIGVDRRVKPGQNVRQEGNYLFSTIDGVMQEHANKVSVLGVIKIMGDVNMRSGNIRAPYSAVTVSGSVQSGATINVGGRIRISEVVEDAILQTESDIVVGGGILMDSEGKLTAGATIRAGFARNARLSAGGDVLLRDSAMNCQLSAGGKIVVTSGRGCIIGGHCQARDKIEVLEAGSERRVTTELRVGSSEADDQLRKEVRSLEEELASLGKMIGRRTHEHLSALPERTRSRLRLAMTERTGVMETLEALKARQNERKGLDIGGAEIVVRNCAHPGVTIMIQNAVLELQEPQRHCRFHLSPEGEIQVSKLR